MSTLIQSVSRTAFNSNPTLKQLKNDLTTVWEKPSPNSIFYTQPITLLQAKESRSIVERIFPGIQESIDHASLNQIGTHRIILMNERETDGNYVNYDELR